MKKDLKPVRPPFAGLFIGISVVYFLFWKIGILPFVLVFVVLQFFISPFPDIYLILHLLKFSFRRYPPLPWTFNISGLATVYGRTFVLWPVSSFFWLIDEYLYTDWKSQKVERPVLVLGQPRSGTTKLEEVLEEDKQFVCFKNHQVVLPFACAQTFLFFLWRLDQKYFRGRITETLKKKLDEKDQAKSKERSQMRRVGLHHAEEDDFFFLTMFYEGVFTDFFHPIPEAMKHIKYFARHYPTKRKLMMEEHKKAVQKILWVHQNYENSISSEPVKLRYVAKWVVGWPAETEALVNFYSDSECLFIVRPAEFSLPSWFKLYGLLSQEYTGYDLVSDCPSFREAFKELNVEGFQNEINLWNSLPENRRFVIDFFEFYSDIPKSLSLVYQHFNWNLSPTFQNRLQILHDKQKSFQTKTKVDESQITTAEIKKDFKDVYSTLLGRKKQD